MRYALYLLLAGTLVAVAFVGLRGWQIKQSTGRTSQEVVEFTPEKRALLIRLRSEHKFQPHEYPPLGYTGAENAEDEATASAAVNGIIDALLVRNDGPIEARSVSELIGRSMSKVNRLATEDRDRTGGYMIEIWYILGFRGSTGRFSYGSYFTKPSGYGEPLPPGWTSPTQPRPIG